MERNDISVSVFDTPGFDDPQREDEQIAKEINTSTCRKIDLILCCFDISTRVCRSDLNILRQLNSFFNIKDWRYVLIILTFANDIDNRYDLVEAIDERKLIFQKYLIDPEYGNLSKHVATNIPVIPAGFKHPDLPGQADWLSNLWHNAFVHVKAKQAFIKLVKGRERARTITVTGLPQLRSISIGGEEGRGQLTIVIMGRIGVGKSTLLNGIIGQYVAKCGSGAGRVTDAVKLFKSSQNGVQIQVIDTPGFDDPSIDDKDTIKEIIRKTKKEVDMILVCLDIRQRVSRSDMSTFRNLKEHLMQKKEDWSCVLVVLTRANQLDPPEPFATYVNKYSKAIRCFVTEKEFGGLDSTTARDIPIVPAGHRNPALPGIEDWLSNIWQTAFECVSRKQDFLRLVEHRLADPGKEIGPAVEPCNRDRVINIGKGGDTFVAGILSAVNNKTSKVGMYFYNKLFWSDRS